MNKVKIIVQWVLVALFALCALGWCPSLSSFLFLLGAVVLLPIKKFEEIFEKFKLKYAVRIVIAVILLIAGFVVAPEKAPATAKKEA